MQTAPDGWLVGWIVDCDGVVPDTHLYCCSHFVLMYATNNMARVLSFIVKYQHLKPMCGLLAGIFKQMLALKLNDLGQTLPPSEQVIILLDLSDPDRNHDVELEDDYATLREHGVIQGSVLSVHALCASDGRDHLMQEAGNMSIPKFVEEMRQEDLTTLVTPIGPAEADHSYNGIIFDIGCKGPYEIAILVTRKQ